jgi:putative lipase involved disintegration of autophagic bodies
MENLYGTSNTGFLMAHGALDALLGRLLSIEQSLPALSFFNPGDLLAKKTLPLNNSLKISLAGLAVGQRINGSGGSGYEKDNVSN